MNNLDRQHILWMAEKAERMDLTPDELQTAVALLLRDLTRRDSGGFVGTNQEDVTTIPHPARVTKP